MSETFQNNNRRLVKNTVILYCRMFLTMGISLLTPRLLLKNLGAENFGVCNVIGSVVMLCNFFGAALGTASGRFLSFEMERGDKERLSRTFSQIWEIHMLLAVVIIVLGEGFGLWYFHHKLVIPPESFADGLIFLHMTVIITAVSVFHTPYSTLLISRENMKAFAGLSIVEVLFHFSAAFLLRYIPAGRLRYYGYLYAALQISLVFFYYLYCRIHYQEAKIRLTFDKTDFKALFSFITWNMIGNAVWASAEVLLNLLLNFFGGPILNAARGIATQLFVYSGKFTQNFLMASRPQIVKYWSLGQKKEFENILSIVCRCGYILLLIFTVPLIVEMPTVLSIWLGDYPAYTVSFCNLTLICGLINFFSFPIVYAVQATGRIARFELLGSGVRILVPPAAYFWLRGGGDPTGVLIINCIVTFLCVAVRFRIMIKQTGVSFARFCFHVFLPLGIITAAAFAASFPLLSCFSAKFGQLAAVCAVSTLTIAVVSYFLLLQKSERHLLFDKLRALKQKFTKI